MIGMVLVTHGGLAAAFVATLEHIVDEPLEQAAIVSIGPDDDMVLRRAELLDKVAAVDDGSGVVVLTDMFGGTPSNLAISILEIGKIEVVAGVNLPMLIKLAAVRDTMPIDAAAEAAKEAGRKNINVASSLLASRAT
jgi:PTS system mannose-specific IIA component